MELRQIEYFLKVAELQHMTKAANELHIAQPALSKTIKTLEEDLGTPLFARVGNRIQLNPAGEIFLEYAQKMHADTENVRKELDDYMKTEKATIRIQKNLSFEMIYLAIIRFNRLYPSVKFVFSSLDEDPDRTDDWDFWLSCTPNPVNSGDTRTILTERIQLGVPFSNPLSGRSSVSLRELKDEPFIFSLPLHSALNEIMFMHCRLSGFTPKRFIETGTKDDVNYVLRNGIGITFAPELSWYYMTKEQGFALVPIEDPVCTRCINLSWKTAGYVSKAAVLFREFVLDFIPHEVEKLRKQYNLPEPLGESAG